MPDLEDGHEKLEAAGDQLRALPLDARAERVEAILAELDRANSPLRTQLEAGLPETTGFGDENLRRGLALAFGRWREEGVGPLLRSELGGAVDPERCPRTTAVIAAGAIPMPTIEAMLMPLLLGSTVRIRPAQRDPITAGLLRAGISALDPLLGACLEVVEFERGDTRALTRFLAADAVVASGSDASIATIRQRLPPGTRFAGYGHRLSVAVVGAAPSPETLAGLALDLTLWDQLGCLSPVAVFALSHADDWADGLAMALANQADVPRGEVPLEAAAALRHERSAAEIRQAAGEPVRVLAGEDWTVVREADAAWRPCPLYRFIRVVPVSDAAHLATALIPVREHLSSVGFAPGFEEMTARLAPRRARLGTMQTPGLDWNHDGIGTLRPLLTDIPAGHESGR